uniref:Uncharacterized protein n=2 Tax=Oryza TaxID=4527 RepID=A0A0D3GWU6_9ORYZ
MPLPGRFSGVFLSSPHATSCSWSYTLTAAAHAGISSVPITTKNSSMLVVVSSSGGTHGQGKEAASAQEGRAGEVAGSGESETEACRADQGPLGGCKWRPRRRDRRRRETATAAAIC